MGTPEKKIPPPGSPFELGRSAIDELFEPERKREEFGGPIIPKEIEKLLPGMVPVTARAKILEATKPKPRKPQLPLAEELQRPVAADVSAVRAPVAPEGKVGAPEFLRTLIGTEQLAKYTEKLPKLEIAAAKPAQEKLTKLMQEEVVPRIEKVGLSEERKASIKETLNKAIRVASPYGVGRIVKDPVGAIGKVAKFAGFQDPTGGLGAIDVPLKAAGGLVAIMKKIEKEAKGENVLELVQKAFAGTGEKYKKEWIQGYLNIRMSDEQFDILKSFADKLKVTKETSPLKEGKIIYTDAVQKAVKNIPGFEDTNLEFVNNQIKSLKGKHYLLFGKKSQTIHNVDDATWQNLTPGQQAEFDIVAHNPKSPTPLPPSDITVKHPSYPNVTVNTSAYINAIGAKDFDTVEYWIKGLGPDELLVHNTKNDNFVYLTEGHPKLKMPEYVIVAEGPEVLTGAQMAQMGAGSITPSFTGPLPKGGTVSTSRLEIDPKYVFEGAKKVGVASTGSHPVEIWESAEGLRTFVKRYEDPSQAFGEALANSIYDQYSSSQVPIVNIIQHEGETLLASRDIKQLSYSFRPVESIDDISSESAQQFIKKGFVVDVLTANRDATGLNFGNMMRDEYGRIARIDQGGALLFRGMQGRKDVSGLHSIAEFEKFANYHPYYKQIFQKAGYEDAIDIAPDIIDQIKRLPYKWDAFVNEQLGAWKGVDKQEIVKMLNARTLKLKELAKKLPDQYYERLVKRTNEAMGSNFILEAWPEWHKYLKSNLPRESSMETSFGQKYQAELRHRDPDFSKFYDLINEWLGSSKMIKNKLAEKLGYTPPPHYSTSVWGTGERLDEHVGVLADALRRESPTAPALYRGRGIYSANQVHEINNMKVGDVIDYVPSSFTDNVDKRENFTGGQLIVVYEIEPGSKSLQVKNMSNLGEDEWITGGKLRITDKRPFTTWDGQMGVHIVLKQEGY